MITPEKQKLLDALDEARIRLNTALEKLDAKAVIYEPWRMKELLDHVSGWDDAVIAALKSHAVGDVPAITAPRGIDYYNEQTVTTRESLPLERTRREYEASRQQLKQAIIEMPDERFALPIVAPWGETGSVAGVVAIFIHHEHEHAADIEKLAAGK